MSERERERERESLGHLFQHYFVVQSIQLSVVLIIYKISGKKKKSFTNLLFFRNQNLHLSTFGILDHIDQRLNELHMSFCCAYPM